MKELNDKQLNISDVILNEEQLNIVNGGQFDEQTIYTLQAVLDAAYTKYNAWLADNTGCTIFEKLAKADEITNEVINSLNPEQKQSFEEFKNDNSALWKEIIKQMAGLYGQQI